MQSPRACIPPGGVGHGLRTRDINCILKIICSESAPMLIAYIATLDLEPGIEQVPRGALVSLSTCFLRLS